MNLKCARCGSTVWVPLVTCTPIPNAGFTCDTPEDCIRRLLMSLDACHNRWVDPYMRGCE